MVQYAHHFAKLKCVLILLFLISYSTGETAASASYDIDDDDDMLDELNSEDEDDAQHDMVS